VSFSFDNFSLSSYDTTITAQRHSETFESIPQFEKGIIKSITIDIFGNNLLSESDVKEYVDITEGRTYTRDEISQKVGGLAPSHKFIKSAQYVIDRDGNLRITVYEEKLLKHQKNTQKGSEESVKV